MDQRGEGRSPPMGMFTNPDKGLGILLGFAITSFGQEGG